MWALTGEVLLRSTEDKGWHRIEAPDGVSLRGLAVSGDEVVVSTDTGLYRVSGDEFELVWSPQRGWAVVTSITDVVAVSGDQAWIVTTDWTSDPPGRRHLQRVQVGRTDPVLVTQLPESPELAEWLWGDVADAPAFARGTDPVVASDGAIWYVANESVIRIAGGSESTVAGRVGEDRLGGHVVNVNVVAMDQGGPERADPRPREIGPDAFVELTVPGRTIAQTLYGDGDINCPDHWAHDRSLPVGQVQYTLTPQAIEITVTLTHAWPDTEYDVSVKTDQFCPEGAQASSYSERLTTDRDGAGSLTLTYQPRHSGPRLLAGYDGAVWMLPAARLPDPEDGEREEEAGREGICLLTPDGRCAAAELPAPAGKIMSLVGGTGGNVWATVCPAEPQEVAACPGGQHLMRWDAGWIPVPYPGADVTGLGAAPDGGFWGILAEKPGQLDDGILAHYREGRWTTFPELADADDSIDNHNDYALTPTGSVCRIAGEGPMLVCVDTSLRISRTPVGWPGKVAVADDGALWVWDNDWDNNVLTRMPITVP